MSDALLVYTLEKIVQSHFIKVAKKQAFSPMWSVESIFHEKVSKVNLIISRWRKSDRNHLRMFNRCDEMLTKKQIASFCSKRDAFALNIVSMQRFRGHISRPSIWASWPCDWTKRSESKWPKAKMVQNRKSPNWQRLIGPWCILLNTNGNVVLCVCVCVAVKTTRNSWNSHPATWTTQVFSQYRW